MRRAVILLSGGLDSATAAAIATHQGMTLHALTVIYGQRHQAEIAAATRVATACNIADHRFAHVDLRLFGGSALTEDVAVPKHRQHDPSLSGIPITYVPARNTVFLSLALAYAEVVAATDIVIGVNAVDYSGYPDCRPAYIEAFEHMANLATRAGVTGHRLTIHTPLMNLTKAEIIREGLRLGVDYSLTHSCYDPDEEGTACGACDSCLIRQHGFAEAGMIDPIRYRAV